LEAQRKLGWLFKTLRFSMSTFQHARFLTCSALRLVTSIVVRTFVLFVALYPAFVFAQPPDARPGQEPDHPASIALWPNGAPGFENLRDQKEVVKEFGGDRSKVISVSNVHNPTITPYLPATERATQCAVIVAPGGGHYLLAIEHEGYAVGQWLADHGVAAFILKYRLENGTTGAKYTVANESLADIQRAIRTVRGRASEWNINPAAVGVMGFSAGGQLAALSAMKFDDGRPDAADPIDRLGSKPNFQALIYPGRCHLILPEKDSPPAFLACSFDDRPEISAGLAEVYLRFHKAGVPAELHIFSSGGHGYGLRPNMPPNPVYQWPDRFVAWLNERGFAPSERGPTN
jgi:endo-1,4-beta-xylanase